MILYLLCRKSFFEQPRRGKKLWTPAPTVQKVIKNEMPVVHNFTLFLKIEDFYNGASFWVNLNKGRINNKYTIENAEIDCRKAYDELVVEYKSKLSLEELMVFEDPEYKCNYSNPNSKWGFIKVDPGEEVGKEFLFNNESCIVKIMEKESLEYKRNGDSLHVHLGITQEESMTGFNKSIKLPNGKDVFVHAPGFRKRALIIKHEGFLNRKTGIKGNLYVKLHIVEEPEYL